MGNELNRHSVIIDVQLVNYRRINGLTVHSGDLFEVLLLFYQFTFRFPISVLVVLVYLTHYYVIFVFRMLKSSLTKIIIMSIN